MVTELSFKNHTNGRTKKQKPTKKAKSTVRKKNKTLIFFSLIIVFISSCVLTNDIYIINNSKNLDFAVEHYFTSGFTSKNKLLRVRYMTLISSDGQTAVVEAFGLSKSEPHKSTSVKGSFKKSKNNSWYLDEIIK